MLANIPVRFFILDDENESGEIDLREVDHHEWGDSEGSITYERHTVFANGCNQICLTKSAV